MLCMKSFNIHPSYLHNEEYSIVYNYKSIGGALKQRNQLISLKIFIT